MSLAAHPDSTRLERAVGRAVLLAVPWAGEAFRATVMAFATRLDLASGEGARLHGGRWTPKGAFRTLYGSLTPEAALAELLEGHRRKGLPDAQALPVAVVGLDIKLQRVLDLTDGRCRQALGISLGRITTEPWERLQRRRKEALTQALGRLARQAGFEGLLVPSAIPRRTHRNIVVFIGMLMPESRVEIVHPEQLAARRQKKA